MRRVSVLVVAVLALAACNGDDSAEPSTTTAEQAPATVESSAPPSSSPPSTDSTTSRPSTAPPTSATTVATTPTTTTAPSTTAPGETDWRAVLETLGQRRQDLYAGPDVSRIGEVCALDSDCANQLNVQIGDLANKGWRVEGSDPFVVLSASLEDFNGDTVENSEVVTVVAVIQRPANAGNIVDSNGSVIAAVEAQTTPGFNEQGRFLLGRSGAAPDEWRIISQDRLPEVPA